MFVSLYKAGALEEKTKDMNAFKSIYQSSEDDSFEQLSLFVV